VPVLTAQGVRLPVAAPAPVWLAARRRTLRPGAGADRPGRAAARGGAGIRQNRRSVAAV